MKLIKPTHQQPENVVQFICSMEMTKHDVKNYLEKIYNVKTVDIRTRIGLGKTRRDLSKGYVTKDEDVKYAYAILVSNCNHHSHCNKLKTLLLLQPKNEKFEYPNIFPSDKKEADESEKKSLDESKKGFEDFLQRNNSTPGTPGWFSVQFFVLYVISS